MLNFRVEQALQRFLQLRIHHLEIVGDVDAGKFKIFESHRDPLLVLPLHHKNHIGPFQVCLTHPTIGI